MRVLFLDDDDDLREAMTDILAALGHELVVARSYPEMVALGQVALECRLAIVDINLGADSPSGVDAACWLSARGFSNPIIFLTGHGRSFPLVDKAIDLGGATHVLQKPMTIKQLETILTEAAQ